MGERLTGQYDNFVSNPLERFNPAGCGGQQHIGAALGKQSVGYDADDAVDLRLEVDRIESEDETNVKDKIAVVRDEAFRSTGLPASRASWRVTWARAIGIDLDR